MGIARTIDRCERYNISVYRSSHHSKQNHGATAEGGDENVDFFAYLLSVCADEAAMPDLGQKIYAMAKKTAGAGAESLPRSTVTAYIHFLMQSEQIVEAERLFRSELKRANEVTFTAMINGYAVNRMIEPAFALYDEMIVSGLKPNERS